MQMPLPVSYSKLSDYEKCPALAAYRYIHRIETPKSPALTRGIGIHKDGELWLRDPAATEKTLPGPYKAFAPEMLELKRGGALAEPTFYVDRDWKPVKARPEAFLVAKLDALLVAGTRARLVDYKTGRPYESHRDQGIVYTLATWAHHPDLREVEVEFWYLDQDEIRDAAYRKSNVRGLTSQMNRRLIKMVEDREFKPTPDERACKWCDHNAKRKEGGLCHAGL